MVLFCLFSLSAFSHTLNYDNQILRHWYISKENRYVDGSFSMFKNGKVFIEDAQNQLVAIPLISLSEQDKAYALQKEAGVEAINAQPLTPEKSTNLQVKVIVILCCLTLLTLGLYRRAPKQQLKYLMPILVVGILTTLYSFAKKAVTTTDPAFVNATFTPFVPNVATSWDDNYFYVESKGIPNHTMMVGISNHGWQQQVPIPQCYIGANHWSIPLNPVLAATPIPIDNIHFTRGAIAIAANGVPIFNYHTNTGVDSFTDGQLDSYGGHCGRGDDYHYHIAPLHLYTLGQTTANLPCAFAFDGFAVYGSVEPDGSAMEPLDTNHGHYGSDGVYHYHGTTDAPYMIANFVGQVTEDNTHQLIPQAAAHPVRTENWTPLAGALITSCASNANNNGYNLSYMLNGVPGYGTNFSWNGPTYTFHYVTPTATTTTNYNGFTQCSVPLATSTFIKDDSIQLFPNPAKNLVQIKLGNNLNDSNINSITVFDSKGEQLLKYNGFKSVLDIKNLASGTYLVVVKLANTQITKKLLVQ